jgi:hypothetical protein
MQRRQLVKALLALTTGSVIGGLSFAALAKPGRPASPTSVAGVRRRTSRRRRRRVHRNMTLTSLPYGCTVTRLRGGVTYYHCGGIWYRPTYQGTTIIYVVEDIDSGANTDVEFEEYE